jgi:mRNA degradation ribonuclease J1/J2
MYHVHCSGHIMPSELKKTVEKIKPKKLFPIHTEYPGLYAKYMSDITAIEQPTKGRRYDLKA